MNQLELFQGNGRESRLARRYKKWRKNNQHVYSLFRRFALEARAAGRERFGAKAIIERMRWHTLIEEKGSDFKLNNNWPSFMVRELIAEDPSFAAFFETRRQRDA